MEGKDGSRVAPRADGGDATLITLLMDMSRVGGDVVVLDGPAEGLVSLDKTGFVQLNDICPTKKKTIWFGRKREKK